ncbi:hypothetical protein HDV63DRAFT_382482 [Trichoderma sp. SZMC 28014]
MSRFKVPKPPYYHSENCRWQENKQPDLRDPDLLWVEYWRRFNTIQLPIFQEEEFFNHAMAIAKVAKNREEFEDLFEKMNRQQHERLMALMDKAGNAAIYNNEIFPCKEAEYTALNISRTGCFIYFAKLLQGSIVGWEADIASDSDDTKEPKDFFYRGTQRAGWDYSLYYKSNFPHLAEDDDFFTYCGIPRPEDEYRGTQPAEDDDFTYCGTQPAGDDGLHETYIEHVVRESQEANSAFNVSKKRPRSDEDDATIEPVDSDISKQSAASPAEARNKPKKRVRFNEDDTTTKPVDNDASKQSAASMTEAQNIPKKQVRFNEDDTTTEPVDNDASKQSAASMAEAQNIPKKRVRLDEDDTPSECKRRKLESSAPCSTPHSISSDNAQPWAKPSIPTAQTTDESLVAEKVKASVDENSPVREYRKRKKPIQNTPASHKPLSTQPVTDGRVSKKRLKHRRKNGNQQKDSPNTLGTRSTRRNTSSLFMELDDMCRPRLINKG